MLTLPSSGIVIMEYNSASPEDTDRIGKEIAQTLCGGDKVFLSGDLGMGKTTLAKAIISSFGIRENSVTSPTFSLLNVYTIEKTLRSVQVIAHIDAYRMKDETEMQEIGAEEHLQDPHTIVILEWPEIVPLTAKNYPHTEIVITEKEGIRTIRVKKVTF